MSKTNKRTILSLLLLVGMAFSPAFAQEFAVKGTVIERSGEPLAGVDIFVKGSTVGVSTDISGHYSIKYRPKGRYWYSHFWDMKLWKSLSTERESSTLP